MNEIPTEKTFETIKKIEPFMNEYNCKLFSAFESFLSSPSESAIISLIQLKVSNIASAASKSYRNTNTIHSIIDITSKELAIGLTLITNGTLTSTEAIDKYHKTVFMLRRPELMSESTDSEMIDNAIEYILSAKISPIAISFILCHEIVGNPDTLCSYWTNILNSFELDTFALLLSKIYFQDKETTNEP